jgi:hypothetical protein
MSAVQCTRLFRSGEPHEKPPPGRDGASEHSRLVPKDEPPAIP